ncbi:hypothetical protein ACA910_000782 [Epithemia clementina (nom. ined.)]
MPQPRFATWRVDFLLVCLAIVDQPIWQAGAEKAYPLGCSGRDPNYYDYDRYPFPPRDPLILKVAAATEINGLPLIRTQDDFLILKRLGTGKFSDVFEAADLKRSTINQEGGPEDSRYPRDFPNHQLDDQSSIVVLKCLKPVSERKIRREVLVLKHASRLPNLARILGVVLPISQHDYKEMRETTDSSTDGSNAQLPLMPTLVLSHAGRQSQWLCHNSRGGLRGIVGTVGTSINDQELTGFVKDSDVLTQYEVKYYLFHLLVALDSLHASGIMHRDVKPRNVLINRQEKRLMLIDLGLADFYLPHQKYNVRVASRHYKSPELLLGFQWYDYAIDMWGVGCILAGLLFHREPLFRGRDNLDQLGKIISRLGSSSLINYAIRYNMQLPSNVQDIISQYHAAGAVHRRSWIDLIAAARPLVGTTYSTGSDHDADDKRFSEYQAQGVDLIERLLVYDHEERLTARQAMQHAFFDLVRDDVLRQVQTAAANTRA